MSFDGTLKFDTKIDENGFKSGLSKLGSIAKSGLSLVTGAIGAASGAVVALGGYSVDVGKNFESSMAQVIATMGITKDTVQDGVNSYELLKNAATEAGETTTFSASEAADALNYLALAGYSAAQSADALPSILNLASAGGLDLAYASDLATDAMAALGITANQQNLTHFGDQLAKTASKANASVGQLGEAILTVGGTAKDLAGGTTELNAALGVLANVGIKGSEGGTALRNMILAMTPTTTDAIAAFERLGVSSYDADGKLRPLNETFKDLNKAMSSLSAEEKTRTLNDIFNKVDLKSASAMLAACASSTEELGTAFSYAGVPAENLEKFLENFNNGAFNTMSETEFLTAVIEDFGVESANAGAVYSAFATQLNGVSFEKLYAEIEDCDGAMQQMADTMNDTLEGDLKSLGSKAEAFGITIFDKINSPLRELVQLGGDYISQLNQALSEGDFSGLAHSVGAVLADAVTTISGYIPQIIDMGASLVQSLADGISENAPQISECLISVIKSLISGVVSVTKSMAELGGNLVISLISGISELLPDVVNIAESLIFSIFDTVSEFIPKIIPIATELIRNFAEIITKNIPEFTEKICGLIFKITENLKSTEFLNSIINAGILIVESLTNGLISAIPHIIEVLPTVIENIVNFIMLAIPELINAGAEIIKNLVDGIAENAVLLGNSAVEIIDFLVKSLSENLPLIINSALELINIFLDAIIENLPVLANAGIEIVTAIIGCISENIPLLLDAAVEILMSFLSFIIENLPLLTDASIEILKQIFNGIISEIPQITKCAITLVESLINGLISAIPQLIPAIFQLASTIGNLILETDWISLGTEIISGIIDGILIFSAEIFIAIFDLWTEISAAFDEYFSIGITEISGFFGDIWTSVENWFSDIVESAKTGASEFLKNTIDFFEKLPYEVGKWLGETIGNIVKWAAEMRENAEKSASEFIENIINFLSELPEKAKNWLDSTIENAKNFGSDLIEKGKKSASDFIENIVDFLSELPEKAKNWLDSTIEKVKNFGTDLIKKGKKAASDLVDEITSKIADLPQKMADSGRNLVEGLWNGITGAGSWLKSKISEFGSGIIDGFKESFGIHSPSTVMRDRVGKFLAQGIGTGFTDELSAVGNDMEKSLDEAIPKPEDFNFNSPEFAYKSLEIKDFDNAKITFENAEIPEFDNVKIAFENTEIPDFNDIKIAFENAEIPEFDDVKINFENTEIPEFDDVKIAFENAEIPEFDDVKIAFENTEIPNFEDVKIPDFEVPEVEFENPEIEIIMPDIEALKLILDIEKMPVISAKSAENELQNFNYDADILRSLNAQKSTMNSGFYQPSPTSKITNNYNYNNVKNIENPPQNITINAQLVLDGNVIAEGIADVATEKIGDLQGFSVRMKKRGVAR